MLYSVRVKKKTEGGLRKLPQRIKEQYYLLVKDLMESGPFQSTYRLKTAIADADGQEAELEDLYVSEARVDGAGRRVGTKQFMEKDRGRAHSIRKEASHIHVTVAKA